MANNAAVKPGNRAAAVLPYLQWGTDDPTVVPTAGSPGYVYFRIPQDGVPPSDVGIYIKINTEGTDTNWILATTNGQIVSDYKDPVDTINPIGTNINLAAPGASINGVVMAAGMSFLVVNQTLPEENGIYDWNGAAVPATRRADANLDVEVTKGMFTWVNSGPTQRGLTGWILTTANPITLGVTPLTFALCPPIAGATTRIPGLFFVASNGTDANPSTRGAIAAPFATIQAAINQAVAEGYNQSNQLTVMVMPKAATYAGFSTSPGISVSGMILNKFVPRVEHANIVPDGAGVDQNTGCSISNLQLVSTAQASLSFPAGNPGRWTINNCRILNNTLGLYPVEMDNAGSVLNLENCDVVSGSATPAISYLAGANLRINGGNIESADICILNSGGVMNLTGVRIQSTALAGYAIDNSGIIQLMKDCRIDNAFGGGGFITRAGSIMTAINVAINVAAPGVNYEVVAGGTLIKSLLSLYGPVTSFIEAGTVTTSPLTGVGYNPAVPSDWAVPPTDVKQALDELAAGFDVENVVYVAKNGSDVTGDGSINRPFLTVVAAMASIVDAAPLKRYAIFVAPGRYNEIALTIKANVFVVGYNFYTTRISNTVDIQLNADFTPAGDHRSGFVNINVATKILCDFLTLTSNEGKFYAIGCQLVGGIEYIAFSNINQGLVSDCDIFANIIQTGFNLRIKNSHVLAGDVVVQPRVGGTTIIEIQSTVVESNVTIGTNTADVIQAFLKGDVCQGAVTFNGVGVAAEVTAGFLTAAPSILNAASVTFLTKSENIEYTPAVPTNWSVVPTEVKAALDELAAKVGADGFSENAYFVAENGSDVTGTGSYQRPFATIQAAITAAAAAGHDFADQANIIVMPSSVPYAGFTAQNGINVIGLASDNKSVIVGAINVTFDGSGFATNAITLANLTVTTAAAQAIQVGAGNAGTLTVRYCRVIMTGGFTCALVNNAGAYVELDDCYVDGGSQTALQVAAGSVSAWNTTYFISTATAVVVQGGDFFAEYCSILSTGGGVPALDHQSGTSTIQFCKVTNSSALAASPAISVAAGSLIAEYCVLSAQGANENVDVAVGATFSHSLCTFAGASSSFANAGTITDLPVFRKRPGKETITLDAGDIVAQFVDLSEEIAANSLTLLWSFAQPPLEGDDYTLSTVGGVTRITFVPGGVLNTLAAAGQKLQPGYLY